MTHGVNLIRLARLVREKRGDRGVREAAAEIGIGHATLNRVERRNMPTLETFAALCRWLPVDPAELLEQQGGGHG